jgi:hypothetical protein
MFYDFHVGGEPVDRIQVFTVKPFGIFVFQKFWFAACG